ncbi:MAG: pentapeptide repeat-containing protein [Streptosporangiaceae bacterium]
MRSGDPGSRLLGLLATVSVAAGLLAFAPGRASAATCPNVDPATHAVSPAPAPGVNWQGCDLTGANLSGASLNSSDLDHADLTGADLSSASMGDVTLVDAVMTDVNLAGATLGGAELNGVSSGGITGNPDLPGNWSVEGGYLVGPTANLAGAKLGTTNLSGADLDGVTSGGVTGTPTLPPNWMLVGGYLVGPRANLAGANLGSDDLSTADLSAVSSGGVTGTPVLPANWTLIQGYLVGPGASLAGANLAGADLSGVDLQATGTPLTDLTNANLRGANLTNANMLTSTMNGAVLTDANLAGANLAGSDMDGVSSGGVTGTPGSLPPNWFLWNGYLIGSGADLAGADLTGLDLSNTNDYSGMDLSGANLTNANLSNDFLSDTVFTNATLTGTDLGGSALQFSISGGISGTPSALPANWELVQGYLIGPEDFLQNATLAGLDLSGLDMFGANFTSADLRGTNLTGAVLQNAVLTRTNLTGANLTDANMTNAITAAATWSNTICPDGTNSNSYVDGCFSPPDTTPPAVTVTHVSKGHVYVRGNVPAAGCRTTDNSAVAVKARLKVTTTGTNGVGSFTATCAGAVDRAGNDQTAPVSASYLVAYGMGGFRSPLAGSTVAKSTRTITVRFRLTNAAGVAITKTAAAAMAAAKKVKSTLAGPGIKPVTSVCRWAATAGVFACAIKIPAGVRTGKSELYTITATENLGTGFIRVPALAKAANPETIHFRWQRQHSIASPARSLRSSVILRGREEAREKLGGPPAARDSRERRGTDS